VRALTVGDTKSEEEEDWLTLDKILSPHVFTALELVDSSPADPPAEGKPSSRDQLFELVHSLLPPSPARKEDAKANVDDEGKFSLLDGDRYEVLRKVHDAEDDSLRRWKCSFNRQQLLALYKECRGRVRGEEAEEEGPSTPGQNDSDKMKCMRLLEKYYVSEEESSLGQLKLSALYDIAAEVSKIAKEDHVNFDHTSERSMSSSSLTSNQSVTKSNMTTKRIWGSWDTVHPASAGLQSQSHTFMPYAYNASRDHPASYAVVHEDVEDEEESDDEDSGNSTHRLSQEEAKTLGLKTIVSLPTNPNNLLKFQRLRARSQNDSKYFIAEDTKHLAKQDPKKLEHKIVLLTRDSPYTLFEAKDCVLKARQSRSIRFDISDKEVSGGISSPVFVFFDSWTFILSNVPHYNCS